jgi:hypothetical protein
MRTADTLLIAAVHSVVVEGTVLARHFESEMIHIIKNKVVCLITFNVEPIKEAQACVCGFSNQVASERARRLQVADNRLLLTDFKVLAQVTACLRDHDVGRVWEELTAG